MHYFTKVSVHVQYTYLSKMVNINMSITVTYMYVTSFFFFAFADVLLNNKTALFIMLFKLVSLDK